MVQFIEHTLEQTPESPTSIQAYNTQIRAKQYHKRTGFDPERKARMLEATLRILQESTPKDGNLLELGAGSGLFTKMILDTQHFDEIMVTDGAKAMLDIARSQLDDKTKLQFRLLDFSTPDWQMSLAKSFSAVTSSMAIHHEADKQQLFKKVYEILKPGGAFVFADHIAGSTHCIDEMIGRERGRIKLSAMGKDRHDSAAMSAFLAMDAEKQAAEGNRCESLANYLNYLTEAGFQNVDCLWRDYWLAVFVAMKKPND